MFNVDLKTMKKKFKPSKKHLAIFEQIAKRGYYKPAYSDQEPATKTLINLGLVDWKTDYRGLILTKEGEEYIECLGNQSIMEKTTRKLRQCPHCKGKSGFEITTWLGGYEEKKVSFKGKVLDCERNGSDTTDNHASCLD